VPVLHHAYWAVQADALLGSLDTTAAGLTSAEDARRLGEIGPNRIHPSNRLTRVRVALNQIRNPLLLVLLFAASASVLMGEWIDAQIVLAIVIASAGVGYVREYSAETAVGRLQGRIRPRARTLRDGRELDVFIEQVVPGDVVLLSAGSLVPADGVLLEATDCFVSEAVLTGESFPVIKQAGTLPAQTALRDRSNCVFRGTNVRSGTARALIVATGPRTEFGLIASHLAARRPETEFERGIRHFGYLLTSIMVVMVLVVFVAHVLSGRPPIDTLLFSIALAVGLSPELLPTILNVSLAHGAQIMAQRGVLARRLNAIENLGSMDVLCTDKTGTLTEGVVRLEGAFDPAGRASAQVQQCGACNAALETGVQSALNEAILRAGKPDLTAIRKVAEIPFDFVRKRTSVVIQAGDRIALVTTGSFRAVLEICAETSDGAKLDAAFRSQLEARFQAWSERGIRVLAVAHRELEARASYGRDLERALVFDGFLTFLDSPKGDAANAIADLGRLGVIIKVITGDAKPVAQHVASLVGLRPDSVLTGADLDVTSNDALGPLAERTDLFVEVDPNQKERLILALKKMGHVVGFLGDGVNDAPAMHAADTSLSVEQAVDVAREAADFVLLEPSLDVVRQGILEGRRIFANTLKYVLTTMSANLGNMISMAAASLVLPFLPLLAGQILLNNFLSDIPAVGIATDRVDVEQIARPHRWNMRFIGGFMMEFGLLSSLFDAVTFAVLLLVFRATPALFRTAWFVESLLTELVIALVVRTRGPFFRSRPGTMLLWSSVVLIGGSFAIPYLPIAEWLGFETLPSAVLAAIALITVLYVAAAELAKQHFYRLRGHEDSPPGAGIPAACLSHRNAGTGYAR
jgi:Mg2+-importing ATPase